MKKIYFLLLIVFLILNAKAQCPWTFTVFNYSPSYSITCNSPTLNLTAQSNTNGVTYLWSGPSFTQSAATSTITNPGNYTVTATAANSCVISQTFAIGVNTIAPTNTVSPLSQEVSCNTGSPTTFTATALSPTANIQHTWYSPLNPLPNGGPILSSQNPTSILSGNLYPGVYTLQTTNLSNGCKVNKTFTVTSLYAYPTFSLSVQPGYSVGCAPLNQFTICILNPVSTQTPPATCSYTFLPPTFTSALTPSIILSPNTCTTSLLPGNWTVVVQDNSNFCRSELPLVIVQNTTAPNVAASMVTQTLTCNQPTIYGVGTSTTANVTIGWTYPGQVPQPSPSTLILGPPNGPPTSTATSSYGVYTVTATNTINGCSSNTLVTINQSFQPPISLPALSIASPTTICNNTAVLTIGASTTQSNASPPATPINPCWAGPVPQTPSCGPLTYSCMTPGIYTLTLTDSYNGCSASGTINIPSAAPGFSMQLTPPTGTANCNGSVVITPQQPNGYTISVTSGTLNGNNISNLCLGTLTVCLTYTSLGCTTCQTLGISQTTGLHENMKDGGLIIYPNPSGGSVYFKTGGENGMMNIYNAEGKLISQSLLNGKGNAEVQEMSPGIYFVELKTDEYAVRKKLIVLQN